MPGLRNSCGDDLAFHSGESPFACWPVRVEKTKRDSPRWTIDALFHVSSRDGIISPHLLAVSPGRNRQATSSEKLFVRCAGNFSKAKPVSVVENRNRVKN